MKEQANYLVQEIGKLKGSIVKIGQMMALYGEHFLPEEIKNAKLYQPGKNSTEKKIYEELKKKWGNKY